MTPGAVVENPEVVGEFGIIEGLTRMEASEGLWRFDEDDWALYAMLCDPVNFSELLFEDRKNEEYGGCYHVLDYQYPLFRYTPGEPYEIDACARSVGKTESAKAKGCSHAIRRDGDNLLISGPELIHLMPLCDAIEERIRDTRLLRELLDTRNGQTGFTHKPFEVRFLDGTRIIGRIPKLSGTGVKGQHQPDLIVDEGQDYPEKGWIEIHETVMKDRKTRDGEPDFTYVAYGVHSGARDTRFYKLASGGNFKLNQITALMRPGWGPDEKRRAADMYGGTQAPDYRRNILGEAGGASSAFFVTARLMACLDQDRESHYNTVLWKRQELQSEEIDKMLGEPSDDRRSDLMMELFNSIVDVPDDLGQETYLGCDLGLVNDPTVVTLWSTRTDSKKRHRLSLRRMWHLWRFREKQIRQFQYVLGWKVGKKLRGAGYDVTGLGLPIFQGMQDDEVAPQHLLDVTQGYVFNAKVPVGVDPSLLTQDSSGAMRDQYGNIVKEEIDPFTGIKRYVIYMTMIEASTRYLREWVDALYLELPFDTEIAGDFQGETEQRVKAMAGMKKKPAAFHILDSARAFAMVRKHGEVMSQVAAPEQGPVLPRAVDARVGAGGEGGLTV
jgi:hypothetical protein